MSRIRTARRRWLRTLAGQRHALRASAARRADPSGTNSTVKQYIADLNRRWARVEQLIRTTVIDNDALGLGVGSGGTVNDLLAAAAAGPATRYEFRTDLAGKADDFMAWLNEVIDDEVLGVTRGAGGRIASNRRWQSVYVRTAYSKGVAHAEASMKRAGIPFAKEALEATFNRPVHARDLALLYTRQFEDLQGIGRVTSQQISRVLTEGLARGESPRRMAAQMVDRVRKIGRTRSHALARTETIRAHAEATLNRYEEAGVAKVGILAEFYTAQDELVCPECLAWETGEALPMASARGVIPVHTNCRCVWLPVVG